MLVYDPINLENLPVADYLDNDANNIVIVLNKKAYGVNKALFMFNNEMKRCIIANNALLKKKTYDNQETFYNIGYFIGKKAIVNQNKLNDVLKEHRVFELTSKTSGDTYINKELLELSTIGILKPPSKKSVGKVNFQYAYEDVYFDELMSKILHEQSGSLFTQINYNLLYPDYYNNDKPLEYYYKNLLFNVLQISNKDNLKNIDFKKGLDKAIANIDRGFIEAAPRYEKTYIHKVFYRGMKEKYINTNGNEFENIGDMTIIKNYTSISSTYNVAKSFALPGAKAFIYKIYLEEGLPFINMVSTTAFKHEKEYLLPRNIIFELISKKGNEYTVIAKPFKKDQFTIKTGCFELDLYDIAPIKLPTTLSSIKSKKLSSSPLKVKSKADSAKSKDNVKLIKKRCPKGMVRNKITKECVYKHIGKTIKKPNSKLKRCPKGTRRNLKTLQCETKLTKL